VPNWIFVHNHLHTVHAIASCNAAEMAMGMLMEATVPTTHRWIPKAMTVQYLQKATARSGLHRIGAMALADQVAVEHQHLVHRITPVIAIVDHEQ
jgi:hypothetical protein